MSMQISAVPIAPALLGADSAQIVTLLLSISKSTRAFISLLLADIDLHPGQDQLLDRLERGTTVSVSELADQLAVRPSTVSKMLDRLIEKNLVKRVTSSGDARRTLVELTDDGEVVKRAVRGVWQRLDNDLQSALQTSGAEQIAEALEQMDTVLRTKLRRLR